MMKSKLTFLSNSESPWLFIGNREEESSKWIPSYFYSNVEGEEFCVRFLRGRKMKSWQGLHDEFSASLQFFDGYGEVGPALEECLECLDEWLPTGAYVLVVEGAEEVLIDEEEQEQGLSCLLGILNRVGISFSLPIEGNPPFDRPPIPFHVLLFVSDGISPENTAIWKVAKKDKIPFHT
jgi:hypothetical protein